MHFLIREWFSLIWMWTSLWYLVTRCDASPWWQYGSQGNAIACSLHTTAGDLLEDQRAADMQVSQRIARAFGWTLIVLAMAMQGASAFREGDVVPTARHVRWADLEAPWEDLLARHCARFKQDSRIAVPLPKTQEMQKRKEEHVGLTQKLLRGRMDAEAATADHGGAEKGAWRVAFAFESGGVATSWTLVDVEKQELSIKIQHRDGNLIGAEMRAVQAAEGVLDREYLLVRYQWIEEKGTDGTRGLLWMSASALFMITVMLVRLGRRAVLDEKPPRQRVSTKSE